MTKSAICQSLKKPARQGNKVVNKGAYIEGNKYVITWALGHLVGLKDPESYDEKYKTWSMQTLPMLPKHMKLTVLKKTSKQFYEVKKLFQKPFSNAKKYDII